jgi:6-pyruvoyltetrahydropterin/6-carboxytetrahydropterin synthase
MLITKEIQLDYGHTLPNHYSFCNQLHGHRARVLATVSGEICADKGSSSQGMVLDFSILKKIMMEKIHGILDHGFAVWKEDKKDLDFVLERNTKVLVTDEPPTAEYLAKWAFNQIKAGLEDSKGIFLMEVQWYETPNSVACYSAADADSMALTK